MYKLAKIPLIITLFFLLVFLLISCDAAKDLLDDEGDESPPLEPSHLEVSLEDDGTIGVVWQDNSDNEDGFIIEVKLNNDSWDEIADLGRNRSSYTYDEVEENASYRFRVLAYNGVGESNWETSETIQTPFNAPTDLSASTTETTIILSWADNSEVEEGYRIFRKEVGQDWETLDDVDENVVSYTNSGDLEQDVSYNYRVVAFNGNILSDYSNEVTAQIGGAGILQAPSGLNASGVGVTGIRLVWTDNSDGEEGFRIQRHTDEDTDWEDLDVEVEANEETYIDEDDIEEGVRYYYRVYAYAGQRVSGFSNEVWTYVGESNEYPPATPQDLTAENREGNSAELRWVDVSNNEEKFVIQKRFGEGAFEEVVETAPNVDNINLINLESGYNYFRIYAENEYGQSDYSNVASILVAGGGGETPDPPTGLSVDQAEDHLIISWDDNSHDETGFRLFRKIGDDSSWEERTTLEANVTQFGDWWALVPGAAHYYYVTAFNDDGESEPSNIAYAVFETGSGVEAPSNLQYSIDGDGGEYTVQLTWQDNSDNESEFVVERAMEEGGFEPIGTSENNTYSDREVFQARTYRYRVFARNENASSNYSNVVHVYIEEGGDVPTAPSSLGGSVGVGFIDLDWQDNSDDEEGFNIERSVGNNQNFQVIGQNSANDQYFTDTDVVDETYYYYRVNAYNESGTSDYSNEIQVIYAMVVFDTVFATSFEGYDLNVPPPDWDGWNFGGYDPPASYIYVDNQHPRSGTQDLQFCQLADNEVTLWKNFDSISIGKIIFHQYFSTYSNLELVVLADGADEDSWRIKVFFLDNGNIAYTNGTETVYTEFSYPFNDWSQLIVRWSYDNTYSVQLGDQWVVETSNMNPGDGSDIGCIKFNLPSSGQSNHILDDLSILRRITE